MNAAVRTGGVTGENEVRLPPKYKRLLMSELKYSVSDLCTSRLSGSKFTGTFITFNVYVFHVHAVNNVLYLDDKPTNAHYANL